MLIPKDAQQPIGLCTLQNFDPVSGGRSWDDAGVIRARARRSQRKR